MNKINTIIVGQGIAGTMLSHELVKRGEQVVVIDRGLLEASSYKAGGVINPITGRNFVKSWRVDDFLPYAKSVYVEFNELLKGKYFQEVPSWWPLRDVKKENDWLSRACLPENERYMEALPKKVDVSFIQEGHTYGVYQVNQGGRVNAKALLTDYRAYLINKGMLLEEAFEMDEIGFSEGEVHYKNLIADRLIFCTGHRDAINPYFDILPFNLTRGEFFILKIPSIPQQAILKLKRSLVPMGDDLYWYGATYDWNVELEDIKANKAFEKVDYEFMKKELDAFLSVPYEIVSHQVGVRPTTVDRRPIIKQSKKQPSVYMFSGMGSKGFSQAPLLAKEFVDSIL